MTTKTWTMKDGSEIEISKMETSHIKNAIAMIDRKIEKGVKNGCASYEEDNDFMTGDVWIEYGEQAKKLFQPEYDWLKEELKNRIINLIK